MKKEKLESYCVHFNSCEVRAQKASRDSIKYKQAEYLSDKVGSVFEGVITSVQDYGVFVTISENNCDCLVRMCDIGGDTYASDLKNHRVVGYNTGSHISLGDKVSIVISHVDIERKNINAVLINI